MVKVEQVRSEAACRSDGEGTATSFCSRAQAFDTLEPFALQCSSHCEISSMRNALPNAGRVSSTVLGQSVWQMLCFRHFLRSSENLADRDSPRQYHVDVHELYHKLAFVESRQVTAEDML
jgi:hypothetical protein